MKKFIVFLFLLLTQLDLAAVSTQGVQPDGQEERIEPQDGLSSALEGLGIQNSLFPSKQVRFPDDPVTAMEYAYVQDRVKSTSNTLTQLAQIVEIFEDWLADVKQLRPVGNPGFERKELLTLLVHVQDSLPGASVSFTKVFNSLFSLMRQVQVSKNIENYNRLLIQVPVDEKALKLDIDKIEENIPKFIEILNRLKQLYVS